MKRRLCCLLLCGLLLSGAALAAEAPSLEQPLVGVARLEELTREGRQVTLDFSISLEGYMGIAKAQRNLLTALLRDLSISYTQAALPDGQQEQLTISGPQGALLDLSYAQQDQTQWVWGPQLDQALTATAGTPLLEALLGSVIQTDASQEDPAQETLDWTAFRQAYPPLGNPQEGYAYLLEDQAALQVTQALYSALRLGQPADSLQTLLFGRLDFTEPVSLYWTEDEAGRLLSARLVTEASFDEGAPWQVSLSLKSAYRKETQTLDLECALQRGDDALDITLGCRDTLDKQTVKRQLRLRLEGKIGGNRRSLDLRQTDTNNYTLQGDTLTEKLTRTLTFSSEDKSPEAQSSNTGAYAGTLQERATWTTGDQDVSAKGSLSIEATRMGDELLTASLPFRLSTGAGGALQPPEDALSLDLEDPQDAARVSQISEALWQHLLQTWVAGLDEEALTLLTP